MAGKNFEFEDMKGAKERPKDANFRDSSVSGVDMLLDIPVTVSVELGRVKMKIEDLMRLATGSVVELNKLVGEPLDIYVNDRLIARGEAVVTGEKLGIRVTEFILAKETLTSDNSSSNAA